MTTILQLGNYDRSSRSDSECNDYAMKNKRQQFILSSATIPLDCHQPRSVALQKVYQWQLASHTINIPYWHKNIQEI